MVHEVTERLQFCMIVRSTKERPSLSHKVRTLVVEDSQVEGLVWSTDELHTEAVFTRLSARSSAVAFATAA